MSRVLLPPVIYSGIPLAVTGGVLRAVASWDTVQHYDRGWFHRAERGGRSKRPGDY